MKTTQLELFQIPINTQYKPGDWVIVRRKPKTGGAHLKRGDTVEISVVHPTDGSIKFWNDRCNSWDYLYPEDFKLTVNPTTGLTDSGNKSNPTTTVEPVVGSESKNWPRPEDLRNGGKNTATNTTTVNPTTGLTDSGNKSNPTTSGWVEWHYKIRIDGHQRSIPHWEPRATGPYYQYRWKEGKRQRGKYLPHLKVKAVQEAIKCNASPSEILKIISNQ